jgi:hypothetical protein
VVAHWWRTLFNALYLKTDGHVVGNATLTSNDVDAVVAAAALKHTDRILEAAQERTLAAREAQVANRRDTDSKASVVAQGAST